MAEKIIIKLNGAKRKEIAALIGAVVCAKPKYQGMPTAAYLIGKSVLDKDGVFWMDDAEAGDKGRVLDALRGAGFGFEEEAKETMADKKKEPETANPEPIGAVTISIPADGFTAQAEENLKKILDAKGSLIMKALGAANAEFRINGEKIDFPWFDRELELDEMQASKEFIAELTDFAKHAKRVTAKERAVENEKYAFRCFLLRLGFIGSEWRGIRKTLLKRLDGSAAFRDGKAKEVRSGEREVSE